MILQYANLHVLHVHQLYFLNVHSIGIIIPGILAQEFDRNGIPRTSAALIIVAVVIKAVYELLSAAGVGI